MKTAYAVCGQGKYRVKEQEQKGFQAHSTTEQRSNFETKLNSKEEAECRELSFFPSLTFIVVFSP